MQIGLSLSIHTQYSILYDFQIILDVRSEININMTQELQCCPLYIVSRY